MGRQSVSKRPSNSTILFTEKIGGCLKYSIVGLPFPYFPHKAEPLLVGKDHDGAVAGSTLVIIQVSEVFLCGSCFLRTDRRDRYCTGLSARCKCNTPYQGNALVLIS